MEIGKREVLSTLQRFDLMGTGCRAHRGMDNEYASEAERIARRVADGKSLRDAIVVTFEEHFWTGCLQEAARAEDFEKLLHDFEGHAAH
jgi:hypothetical protein